MKSSPTNACSCIDQRAKGWKKKKEKILILYKTTGKSLIKEKFQMKLTILRGIANLPLMYKVDP